MTIHAFEWFTRLELVQGLVVAILGVGLVYVILICVEHFIEFLVEG